VIRETVLLETHPIHRPKVYGIISGHQAGFFKRLKKSADFKIAALLKKSA